MWPDYAGPNVRCSFPLFLNETEYLVVKDAVRSTEWDARAGPNVLKAQILSMKTVFPIIYNALRLTISIEYTICCSQTQPTQFIDVVLHCYPQGISNLWIVKGICVTALVASLPSTLERWYKATNYTEMVTSSITIVNNKHWSNMNSQKACYVPPLRASHATSTLSYKDLNYCVISEFDCIG